MKLTIIGCSGSYPGPDSPASCYLLETHQAGRTWRILLDLGSGALGALHRYVDPMAIDAVFLSHLHADHCLDMCGFYVLRKYHPTGAAPRIPVFGPAGTAARLATAYDLPLDPGMSHEFDFVDFPDGGDPTVVGPFEVTVTPVDHPIPAFALRIQVDDRVLVYSGDTGPCSALEQIAVDADLFLAEASFCDDQDNPANLHLTGSDAGRVAATARVGQLVLTHIPPWYDPQQAFGEAKTQFPGPLAVARSGATYQI